MAGEWIINILGWMNLVAFKTSQNYVAVKIRCIPKPHTGEPNPQHSSAEDSLFRTCDYLEIDIYIYFYTVYI